MLVRSWAREIRQSCHGQDSRPPVDSSDIRDTHTGWSCYTNNAAALAVVMADEVFDGTDVVRQLFREGESVTGHVTDVPFTVSHRQPKLIAVVFQMCTLVLPSFMT